MKNIYSQRKTDEKKLSIMLVEGIGIPECKKHTHIRVTDKLNIWLYVVHHALGNIKMKNNKKKRINEKYLQFQANGKIKLKKSMENNHLENSNVNLLLAIVYKIIVLTSSGYKFSLAFILLYIDILH